MTSKIFLRFKILRKIKHFSLLHKIPFNRKFDDLKIYYSGVGCCKTRGKQYPNFYIATEY